MRAMIFDYNFFLIIENDSMVYFCDKMAIKSILNIINHAIRLCATASHEWVRITNRKCPTFVALFIADLWLFFIHFWTFFLLFCISFYCWMKLFFWKNNEPMIHFLTRYINFISFFSYAMCHFFIWKCRIHFLTI